MEGLGTQLLPPEGEGLHRAVQILRAGGLVAFPTETVYGLGADARDDEAVAGIFRAKGRPSYNPLIVHLADAAGVARYARMSPVAERLAAAFWPGPLTLVLPLARAALSPLVTAGLGTVGVRVPAHPVAQALLAEFGGPLAAPSANPSGRVSPTRAAHVTEGLGGRIDAVLDGGDCDVGVESTIVDLSGPVPRLLRQGGIPQEALEACLGHPLETGSDTAPARPNAPGQLSSHYAPRATLRLNARAPEGDEVWIGFGPGCKDAAFNLSPRGDLHQAAARLFHTLRLADAEGRPIAVAPIPETGLGRAINDRLRRAAAPRPGGGDQGEAGNPFARPGDLP
ncbi:L-threonylcarbamoyladenylate synthase [Halodurantibacterium flavum]|uniref:Threonylcarbamoyl-AMP synthase n=1 Tax=Halodurantibacterium flavum TaxID=1382802 RepID=A0ABW4S6U4_9RHOB